MQISYSVRSLPKINFHVSGNIFIYVFTAFKVKCNLKGTGILSPAENFPYYPIWEKNYKQKEIEGILKNWGL